MVKPLLLTLLLVLSSTLRTVPEIQADSVIGDTVAVRASIMNVMTEAQRLQRVRSVITLDSAIVLFDSVRTKSIAAFGESDSLAISALVWLGVCYYWKGDYPSCDSLLLLAIRSWSESFGPQHPNVGNTSRILGDSYKSQELYQRAEEAYKGAISVLETAPTTDVTSQSRLVTAHNQLGRLYLDRSRFDESEEYFLRTLELKRRLYDPNHRAIANTLGNLCDIYIKQGRHSEADRFASEALSIAREGDEDSHANRALLALCLNNLGRVRNLQGNFSEAESLFKTVLAMRTELFGPASRSVGGTLGNLGWHYYARGELTEAEQYLLACLDVYHNLPSSSESPLKGIVLFSSILGRLYSKTDRVEKARALFEDAVRLAEDSLGADHYRISSPLAGLADLNCRSHNLALARQQYERLLDLSNLSFDSLGLARTGAIIQLAVIENLLNNPTGSLDYFNQWVTVVQRFLNNAFQYASEAQKLKYAQEHSSISNKFLSFALDHNLDSAVAASFNMIINGKSLVADALLSERRVAQCESTPAMISTLKNHSTTCDRIARLTLTSGNAGFGLDTRNRLASLYETKHRLETELSAMCSQLNIGRPQEPVTHEQISDSLNSKTVYVDYVKFWKYQLAAAMSAEEWQGQRYLAFTCNAAGDINVTDLGSAELIDSLVSRCRENIQDSPTAVFNKGESDAEQELATITGELHRLIVEPLAIDAGACEAIFISPDGQLSLLPFEILRDSDGRYLIENFEISYVSTGRDLLRHTVPAPSDGNIALIAADPDFDASTGGVRDQILAAIDISPQIATRAPPNRTGCLDNLFGTLHATLEEAKRVSSLLRERSPLNVSQLVANEASENALKNLDVAPRILHLATHGYYCDNEDVSSNSEVGQNPMLYSGLAFAGANNLIRGTAATGDGSEDGILTSLEASGLNLIGTDLVVLSACQTGVGEVVSGEGVFGLRRAFQHAGARSIIMSMFDIPDKATSLLMERFYENWLSGESKSTALRNASLSILRERRKQHGAAHPLFWGGFILVGDPN